MARSYFIYGASIAVHIGLAVWAGVIHHKQRTETIALEYAEAKKREEQAQKKPLPPAEEQKKKSVARRARLPTAPRPETPVSNATTPLDALPDFGLALSGGVEGDGVLVPSARANALARAAPTIVKRVVRTAPRIVDQCSEALIKAKPKSVPQPSYTADARAASVQGKLRLELMISELGAVTQVKLLQGLGFGLDEAALEAARRATFEPATRCGRPVASRFVIAMRFTI